MAIPAFKGCPTQHLANGGRPTEGGDELAVTIRDFETDDVGAVFSPDDVALVGERAYQVIGGRDGQPTAPGDLFDGQAPWGTSDRFEHAQCPRDASDQVRGFRQGVAHNHLRRRGLTPYEKRRQSGMPVGIEDARYFVTARVVSDTYGLSVRHRRVGSS